MNRTKRNATEKTFNTLVVAGPGYRCMAFRDRLGRLRNFWNGQILPRSAQFWTRRINPLSERGFPRKVVAWEHGGADRNRTCDLLIANETLYQLSYDPVHQTRK